MDGPNRTTFIRVRPDDLQSIDDLIMEFNVESRAEMISLLVKGYRKPEPHVYYKNKQVTVKE